MWARNHRVQRCRLREGIPERCGSCRTPKRANLPPARGSASLGPSSQTSAPPECQAPQSTPKPGEPQGRDGSDDGAQRVHSSFETERTTKGIGRDTTGPERLSSGSTNPTAKPSVRTRDQDGITRSSPRPAPPPGSQTRMGKNESPHLLQPQVSGEPRSTLTHSSVLRGVSARGPANPTGLAHVFLFHSALPGSHDAFTPQVPNHSAGIVRIDHG